MTPINDEDLGSRFEKLFSKKPVALQDNTVSRSNVNPEISSIDVTEDLSLEVCNISLSVLMKTIRS